MKTTFNWTESVHPLTEEQIRRLSRDRGYRPEFLQWLSENGWIGWSEFRGGRWCFPVYNEAGELVAAHQIPTTKEAPPTFYPKGQGNHPLIIGSLENGSMISAYESQWDMLAAMDAANYHDTQKGAYIATRGAANRIPETLPIPHGKPVYAVLQNDETKNGRNAAEDWLRKQEDQDKWPIHRVEIPKGYEDPQAWLKQAGFETFKDGLREAFRRSREEKEERTDKPDKLINPAQEGGISGKSCISEEAPSPDYEMERERIPFPAEELPAIAQRWISGFLAMTNGRMPLALPGICSLGTLSASIGPNVRIRSTAAGDTTGANLFLLAAAESSSGKSVPFKRITKPFFEVETELRERFQKEIFPRMKAELEQLEEEKKRRLRNKNRDHEDQERLVSIEARMIELRGSMDSPRLFCGDATSQAMIRLMARQLGTCLSSVSDDARTIMEIIEGKHNKGRNADDAFFIQAWTGNPFAYDRVTDRENIVIASPWLSALWFVQPDKLAALAENSETFQSGFFQRLLVCNTGASPLPFTSHTDCFPTDLENEWDSLIRRLILNLRRREEPDPLLVQPSREAESLLRDYQNLCVERQTNELADIPTIAGKWAENAWRVALVLHVAENPENCATTPLSIETAERARKIVEWFAGESLRLVAPAREEKETDRAGKLRLILERPKYDRETGVPQGTLSNNHGFTRDELETLCSKYSRVFEKVEKGTTEKGGKPTFFVKLRR